MPLGRGLSSYPVLPAPSCFPNALCPISDIGRIRRGVENFIKHFIRIDAGRWTCFRPATLDTPAGRIQVAAGTTFTIGTKFMNYDVAGMLEEQHQLTHPKEASGTR